MNSAPNNSGQCDCPSCQKLPSQSRTDYKLLLRTYVEKMRLLMAGSLRYHEMYRPDGMSNEKPSALWRIPLQNQPLPLLMDTIAGDVFAYWYGELRLPPDMYEAVAREVFQAPEGYDLFEKNVVKPKKEGNDVH